MDKTGTGLQGLYADNVVNQLPREFEMLQSKSTRKLQNKRSRRRLLNWKSSSILLLSKTLNVQVKPGTMAHAIWQLLDLNTKLAS